MTLSRVSAFKPLCHFSGPWGVTLRPGDPLPLWLLNPVPVTVPRCKGHPGSGGEELLASQRTVVRRLLGPASDPGLPQLWTTLFGTPGNDLDRGVRCQNFIPCTEKPGSCAPCWHKWARVHTAKASASVAGLNTPRAAAPGQQLMLGKECIFKVLKPGKERSRRTWL